MAKLDEVLRLVRLYEEKYRHPNLTRFLVSSKYDLYSVHILNLEPPQ